MMQDLAMHCLDIAYNSIRAQARHIAIEVDDLVQGDRVRLLIRDDGCGMDEEQLQRVTDPFFTTRTTRKIGLGVAFLKGLAEQCDGNFEIASQLGQGTVIAVSMPHSHWDTPPLGDLAETLVTLIQASPEIDIQFDFRTDTSSFHFDTAEIRSVMDDIPLSEPSILMWIKSFLSEQLQLLK